LLFVLIYSLGYGALTPTRAALVAEHFGGRAYGAINGLLTLIVTLTGAGALVLAGAVYDSAGTFIPVLWSLVILTALAVAAMMMVSGLPVASSRLPVDDHTLKSGPRSEGVKP
jgi:MFS family permease